MAQVMVQVDSDLWLPEWVLKARAKERARKLMERQQAGGSISMAQVRAMPANAKVPGVVTVAPTAKKQDFLFIPSLGVLSKEEVQYLVGMVREGGYGKGPQHRSKDVNWEQAVKRTVDFLVEKKKGRIYKVWR